MIIPWPKVVITGGITIRLAWTPPPPAIVEVTFSESEDPMAAKLGHIRLSPAGADITSRPCEVTINGGVATTVDMIDTAATFSCNDGDTFSVVAFDVNAAGKSAASVPFTGTVGTPGGGGGLPPAVPSAPTILGVDFTDDTTTPAPTPTPPPAP